MPMLGKTPKTSSINWRAEATSRFPDFVDNQYQYALMGVLLR
jgi:hypothetical protein